MGKVIDEWLSEYSKKSTKQLWNRRIQIFLEWCGKSDDELIKEFQSAEDKRQWAKETGNLLLTFQNYLLNDYPRHDKHGKVVGKGLKANTVRGIVSAARAFFSSQCLPVSIKRGRIVEAEMAYGEHEFTQDELRRMFYYADVRGKAILSLAVALGWSAEDFVELPRETIEPLLDHPPFTGFWFKRGKTGAPCRGHLTPEAAESLRAWFNIAPKNEYVWPSIGNGFCKGKPISQDTLNDELKRLAKNANIKPKGRIRFHLLRKFLYTQLKRKPNNLDADHAKIKIGKRVPKTDLTYLQSLAPIIDEEVKLAYPKFSLLGFSREEYKHVDEEIELLRQEVEILKEGLISTLPRVISSQSKLEDALNVAADLLEKTDSPFKEDAKKLRLQPGEISAIDLKRNLESFINQIEKLEYLKKQKKSRYV